MNPIVRRAAVIGTGSIGASLAVAARKAGAIGHVIGVGRGRANLAHAIDSGLVDEVSENPFAAVADVDLVVLATPVDSATQLLPALVAAAPERAIFTDVGSVKQPIVEAAVKCGVAERFVGGHPIAGGTGTGAIAADVDLFRGRTVVLTPTPEVAAGACAIVREVWAAVGARVVEMTAARHDEVVALTSHLPQFVAFALCASVGRSGEIDPALFGTGFRDTTRLALSDHDMWLAIAELNRESILQAMDRFASLWLELRAAVAVGDTAALRRIFQEARDRKARLSA